MLSGHANGDDQNDGGGADDHSQRSEGKAQLAGAKAVEGQAQHFTEHHGAACAQQGLLEGSLTGLVGRVH